jgi:hypothetical protein
MKSHKSIAMLMIVVTGIVSLWLYPRINKSTHAKYARVYEDTSLKRNSVASLVNSSADDSDISIRRMSVKKPVYIKQDLVPVKGAKSLEVKMFSRATHFIEERIEIADTLNVNLPVANEEPVTIGDTVSVEVATASEIKRAIE